MQLKLRVVGGQKDGDEIKVPGPKFLIGRDADCHLRPNSDLISRHHCVLILDQGYVGIRDFNSKNGTFVNGSPIRGECELKSGDELEIGPLHFKVHLETGLGGPKRPKVKDVKEALARTAQMAGDDLDIDDWLEGDDPGSDTKTMDHDEAATSSDTSLSDTAELRLQNETLPTETPDEESSSIQDKLKEAEDQAKPKDTSSAALDVLRKFRKQQLQKQKQKDQSEQEKKG